MTIKTLKEKLENPFALVAQGFVVGLILFWATAPEKTVAQTAQSAAVSTLQG